MANKSTSVDNTEPTTVGNDEHIRRTSVNNEPTAVGNDEHIRRTSFNNENTVIGIEFSKHKKKTFFFLKKKAFVVPSLVLIGPDILRF